MKLVSIGFDHEYFLMGSMGEYVNPREITSGTKEEPENWKDYSLTLQSDGMALELGWDKPITNTMESEQAFRTAGIFFDWLQDTKSISTSSSLVHDFSTEQLEGDGGELGCEPDLNAYTKRKNPKPTREAFGGRRFVGRHIHLGVTEDDGSRLKQSNAIQLVKACDVIIGSGNNSNRLLNQHNLRSPFYGMAGSFRPKPYGIEYRVPSYNFLMNTSGDRFWDLCMDAVEFANSDELEEIVLWKGGWDAIRRNVDKGIPALEPSPMSNEALSEPNIMSGEVPIRAIRDAEGAYFLSNDNARPRTSTQMYAPQGTGTRPSGFTRGEMSDLYELTIIMDEERLNGGS